MAEQHLKCKKCGSILMWGITTCPRCGSQRIITVSDSPQKPESKGILRKLFKRSFKKPSPESCQLAEGLGIKTLVGVTYVIPSGTLVPASKSYVFSTATDNQSSIEIDVVAGTSLIAKECRRLFKATLHGFPKAPKGIPQIHLQFTVDEKGLIGIVASDPATGNLIPLKMAKSYGRIVVKRVTTASNMQLENNVPKEAKIDDTEAKSKGVSKIPASTQSAPSVEWDESFLKATCSVCGKETEDSEFTRVICPTCATKISKMRNRTLQTNPPGNRVAYVSLIGFGRMPQKPDVDAVGSSDREVRGSHLHTSMMTGNIPKTLLEMGLASAQHVASKGQERLGHEVDWGKVTYERFQDLLVVKFWE